LYWAGLREERSELGRLMGSDPWGQTLHIAQGWKSVREETIARKLRLEYEGA